MKIKLILFTISFLIITKGWTQPLLKPGFDADEYRTFLKISERQADSSKFKLMLPWPANFKREYVSPITGLDNRFEIWTNKKKGLCVISIRGTTMKNESWLENFTAGMLPSTGKIKFDSTGYISYKVAENPRAFVHSGWMIGMLSMAPDILLQIKKQYSSGYRNFVIFGHSQGGAIAFLLRSYLYYHPQPLPEDIIIKTYSSAAPKPGNLYYSYDYGFITRGGWGLRVVNTLDWVPEVPFAIQTLDDINEISPFTNIEKVFKNMKFFQRIYLKRIYKKLDLSTEKARKRYIMYLGNKTFQFIQEFLPQAVKPDFVQSFDYSTAGTPVILVPQQAYRDNYFNPSNKSIFVHHLMYPYWLACMENYPERD
ncbi:MAG: lipase family protein [Bacteroidales bacterium]|nr:lipase family protein [Bacteroidales bacterium]